MQFWVFVVAAAVLLKQGSLLLLQFLIHRNQSVSFVHCQSRNTMTPLSKSFYNSVLAEQMAIR